MVDDRIITKPLSPRLGRQVRSAAQQAARMLTWRLVSDRRTCRGGRCIQYWTLHLDVSEWRKLDITRPSVPAFTPGSSITPSYAWSKQAAGESSEPSTASRSASSFVGSVSGSPAHETSLRKRAWYMRACENRAGSTPLSTQPPTPSATPRERPCNRLRVRINAQAQAKPLTYRLVAHLRTANMSICQDESREANTVHGVPPGHRRSLHRVVGPALRTRTAPAICASTGQCQYPAGNQSGPSFEFVLAVPGACLPS